MIGATAKAEQFMKREGSEATKPSRKGFSLLVEGVNPVSLQTERQALYNEKAALAVQRKQVENKLRKLNKALGRGRLPTEHYQAALAKREEVKATLEKLSKDASFVNKKLKKTRGSLASYFMDVAHENLPSGQFKSFMSEAARRAEEGSKA